MELAYPNIYLIYDLPMYGRKGFCYDYRPQQDIRKKCWRRFNIGGIPKPQP